MTVNLLHVCGGHGELDSSESNSSLYVFVCKLSGCLLLVVTVILDL